MRINNLAKERIGLININNYDSLMKIIEYNNAHDIWVKFEKGDPIHTNWTSFCKGKVKHPYDKSVFRTGFIGVGKYKVSNNKRFTVEYNTWIHMLDRCFNKKFKDKYPTYKDCSIIDDWLNFQIFAKWYEENHYGIDDQIMHLDKDILIKGNKTYSPSTCIFVPQRINVLFTKRDSQRGDLPIGVYFYKKINKYVAACSNGNGKKKHIGTYNTPEDAFKGYKIYKENLIKKIADLYKDKIPLRLYEALITYEVEITD